MTPIRFPYTDAEAAHSSASMLAYLPITLSHETHSLTVSGLLDTGSTVNVLSYTVVSNLDWHGSSRQRLFT